MAQDQEKQAEGRRKRLLKAVRPRRGAMACILNEKQAQCDGCRQKSPTLVDIMTWTQASRRSIGRLFCQSLWQINPTCYVGS
ncbi:hypothetical protein LZ32DRAFT_600035 [Colletotrichum eremochloae]|nr:hypothetical protein LZ32DRAFT_600035 [Colletotrichum eremochloae]